MVTFVRLAKSLVKSSGLICVTYSLFFPCFLCRPHAPMDLAKMAGHVCHSTIPRVMYVFAPSDLREKIAKQVSLPQRNQYSVEIGFSSYIYFSLNETQRLKHLVEKWKGRAC